MMACVLSGLLRSPSGSLKQNPIKGKHRMRLTSTACLPSKAAANQIWWRWVKAHIQRFLNNQSANKLQQNCFVDHLLQSSVSTFYGRIRLSKQLIRTELQRYAHKFSNSRNQKVNITCCAPKDTIRSTRALTSCVYIYIFFYNWWDSTTAKHRYHHSRNLASKRFTSQRCCSKKTVSQRMQQNTAVYTRARRRNPGKEVQEMQQTSKYYEINYALPDQRIGLLSFMRWSCIA